MNVKVLSLTVGALGLLAAHADIIVSKESLPPKAKAKMKAISEEFFTASEKADLFEGNVATLYLGKSRHQIFMQKVYNSRNGKRKSIIVDGDGNPLTQLDVDKSLLPELPVSKVSDTLKKLLDKQPESVEVLVYFDRKQVAMPGLIPPPDPAEKRKDRTAYKAKYETWKNLRKDALKNREAMARTVARRIKVKIENLGGNIVQGTGTSNKSFAFNVPDRLNEEQDGIDLQGGFLKAEVPSTLIADLVGMPEVELIDLDPKVEPTGTGALNTVLTANTNAEVLSMATEETGKTFAYAVWHRWRPNMTQLHSSIVLKDPSQTIYDAHYGNMVRGISNTAAPSGPLWDRGSSPGTEPFLGLMANFGSATGSSQEGAFNWALNHANDPGVINHAWYNGFTGVYGSPPLTIYDGGNTYTATDRYIDRATKNGGMVVVQAAGNSGASGQVLHKGMNTVVVGAYRTNNGSSIWGNTSGLDPAAGMTQSTEFPHFAIDVSNWQDQNTSTASSLATGLINCLFKGVGDFYYHGAAFGRAVFMASGSHPQNWTINEQSGAGFANIADVLPMMQNMASSGEKGSYPYWAGSTQGFLWNFNVSTPGKNLVATLSWLSDPDYGLNDFDLKVTRPDGTTYWSNSYMNNAELIYIANAQVGNYLIEAVPYNVPAGSAPIVIAWNLK